MGAEGASHLGTRILTSVAADPETPVTCDPCPSISCWEPAELSGFPATPESVWALPALALTFLSCSVMPHLKPVLLPTRRPSYPPSHPSREYVLDTCSLSATGTCLLNLGFQRAPGTCLLLSPSPTGRPSSGPKGCLPLLQVGAGGGLRYHL